MEVKIPIGSKSLFGQLSIPSKARALILFVHGSGSSHLSPRNQYVAHYLEKAGFGTLLFDLLTSEEEATDDQTGALRFDIPFLAERLKKVTEWISKQSPLPICYFGASTGAAAALVAAAAQGSLIQAIVSRGGRPDLALADLPKVTAPTLLIVGGLDDGVIELNQQALEALTCPKKLVIVPKATHLFEEPGKLEIVAELATNWFLYQK